jgi:hypothetical protein
MTGAQTNRMVMGNSDGRGDPVGPTAILHRFALRGRGPRPHRAMIIRRPVRLQTRLSLSSRDVKESSQHVSESSPYASDSSQDLKEFSQDLKEPSQDLKASSPYASDSSQDLKDSSQDLKEFSQRRFPLKSVRSEPKEAMERFPTRRSTVAAHVEGLRASRFRLKSLVSQAKGDGFGLKDDLE